MARSRFSVKEGLSVHDGVASSPFDLVPVGTVVPYIGTAAPDGWLLCDGSTVSRSTYPNLHALISVNSYPFGNGDGSTTFTLPDMRGRFPLGVGDSPDASVPTVRALGDASGAETAQLTTSNLPPHTHTINHDHGSANTGNQSADHSHTINHDHGSANTGNASANHTHSINHDHGAANTGNVSSDHAHGISTDTSSHWHALYFLTDAASGSAKARATAASSTLGNPGGTSMEYHAHSGNTGGINANHTHGFDMPDFAGNSGNMSADHSHAFDMPNFTGNSGGVSADHSHAFDMPAFTGSSGDGAFTNSAIPLMNPFLALSFIIKY